MISCGVFIIILLACNALASADEAEQPSQTTFSPQSVEGNPGDENVEHPLEPGELEPTEPENLNNEPETQGTKEETEQDIDEDSLKIVDGENPVEREVVKDEQILEDPDEPVEPAQHAGVAKDDAEPEPAQPENTNKPQTYETKEMEQDVAEDILDQRHTTTQGVNDEDIDPENPVEAQVVQDEQGIEHPKPGEFAKDNAQSETTEPENLHNEPELQEILKEMEQDDGEGILIHEQMATEAEKEKGDETENPMEAGVVQSEVHDGASQPEAQMQDIESEPVIQHESEPVIEQSETEARSEIPPESSDAPEPSVVQLSPEVENLHHSEVEEKLPSDHSNVNIPHQVVDAPAPATAEHTQKVQPLVEKVEEPEDVIEPTKEDEDEEDEDEEDEDEDKDESVMDVDDGNGPYKAGSICTYCKYCNLCKLCSKCHLCKKGSKRGKHCDTCKYCKYCRLCDYLCVTICQPASYLDIFTGSIYSLLPNFSRKTVQDADKDIERSKDFIKEYL